MSDINKQMAEFAKELWENYIKPKVGIEFSDTVSYYMATVVSNDGYNRVTIKRPFDDAYQVSCLDDMAGLEAGDTVLVLRFGNGTNNANHIVFGKGNGNMNYTAAAATATATEASVAAGQAAEAAAEAIESAGQAASAAESAQESAQQAQESANTANQAANNALIGLATVEGVVDTVNWFAEHKTASTDTSVVPSKTYYAYNPVAGTLSAVTPEGDENPSEEGWYELSEAISNYVATHIATTNDGLYVVGLSNGWKVLVSSGTGTYTAGIFLIDPSGNIAQATTANGITFDDSKPFYIGDNNASIVFDGNGHISISGIGVSIGSTGSKSIDEVLSELGASIKTIEYGVGNSATSHSDITSWSSNTPEWQEDKYIWQRTTTNGLTYTYTCIQGAAGAPGAPGVSVSGVTNYYLATSQSSGVTRETTGWTTSIQTMTSTNQYLWNYEVVTGSDGSTLNTTDPIIIGRYGQDGGSGRGITGITEYYLASDQQTGITPSSSGWTTTVQTTTTMTPYLWNYEVITYSSGSPETSSARIIGTHGETGTPGIDFSQGKMLYTDPSFKAGTNDLKVYNNSEGGTVTHTRSAKSSDNPMSDTSYELVITNTGWASPGIGGFYFGNASRANAIFVYRIIAKIPVGRSIKFASNPTGNYRTEEWLTSQAGTGKFTEYIFRLTCGADGTFATTGFFYIDGDPGTSSSPVNWYLAYATGFDMTNESDVQTAQATANSAEEKIDNLEIGGTNLIPYSINLKSFSKEASATVTYTDDSCTCLNTSSNTSAYGVYYDVDVTAGAQYTLSFYASALSGTCLYAVGNRSAATPDWNGISDGYKDMISGRNVFTFTVPSDCTLIRIYLTTRNNGSTWTVSRLKLEKGNKATDWSPAPEDFEVAIEVAEETATEALNKHGFCSCSTAAGTAAKTATLSNFQLKTGSTVHVTFTNANSVANPTLNINSTGAKTIRWNNANVTAATSPWAAGECVTFVYDGAYWVVSGQSNITADNIVAGSIAADRIKANVISAVNGGTGTINADKVNAAGLTIGQSQVTGLTTALNGKEAAVTTATPTYDTDQIPYMLRQSSKAIMGQESLDQIVGGSLGWNQLIPQITATASQYGIKYVSTGNGTWTITGALESGQVQGWYNLNYTANAKKVLNGHVYYVRGCDTQMRLQFVGNSVIATCEAEKIVKATLGASDTSTWVRFQTMTHATLNKTLTPQVLDLTAMFGSTIADYIYSLESATAGAGVAWLSKYIDLQSYHTYDAGSIQSVQAKEHVTLSKNFLTDYVNHASPGVFNGVTFTKNADGTITLNGTATAATLYYLSARSTLSTTVGLRLPKGNYILSGTPTGYSSYNLRLGMNRGGNGDTIGNDTGSGFAFTEPEGTAVTYGVWIGFNSGAVFNNVVMKPMVRYATADSTYVPYQKHSYPLNGSLTLRGIPKLVNNELQYDGDIYYPNGTVARGYNTYLVTTCTSIGTATGFGAYAYIASLSDTDSTSGVYTPLVCSKYLGVAASGDRAPMTAYIVGGSLVIVNPAFTSLSTAQSILAQQMPVVVYKKVTPTTETATPYQQVQMADPDGTEEFVSTSVVPAGHYTRYPTNLKAAIDTLPVDTTDAAKTATNYITNIGNNGITVTGNNATADVQISNKVRVQADNTHFTDVESTGMKVYSGSASVPVAQFLASGSRVSYDATHYTEFAANSWTICGGTNSPTIKASTYPNTATEATTGMAGLTISNSARTKQLIQLFTYKRTYTGSNPENANITLHAYDTGNEVIGLKTTRLDDGSTAGGVISIQGLGTTNASVDMMSSIGTLNGTQRAGGLLRVHYGTASVSVAAQLRTFGQNSGPSLEFYNTSGTLQSWYGANLAYIYREAGYAGYAAHGKSNAHKYTFEWSTIGSYNYLCFFVDTTEVYRLQQQSYSDERVKKDIEPIRSDYKDAVGAVNITQFRYDFDNETLKDADGIMFGIIAQDLIEELDDKGISYTDTPLVSDMGEDEESLYSVNYTQFLLARIAHDEDRIHKLEEQNHKLEEQNKALEERLSVLEDIMLKNLIRDIDET